MAYLNLLITQAQNQERKIYGYVKVYALVILEQFTGLFLKKLQKPLYCVGPTLTLRGLHNGDNIRVVLFYENENRLMCVGGLGLYVTATPPSKIQNQQFILLNGFYLSR